MSDTRQALEEAWNTIHDYQKAPWQPLAVANGMERFRRFLDAEAWTDAAMMLVPEGWAVQGLGWYNLGTQSAATADLWQFRPGPDGEWWHGSNEGRAEVHADHPALALAQACLKARENGDG